MTVGACGDSGSNAWLGTVGDDMRDSGIGVGEGCRVYDSGKVQGQLRAEMQGAARDR